MAILDLIETLRRAGIGPTALELAEALWLSRHLDPAPRVQPPIGRPLHPVPAAAPTAAPGPERHADGAGDTAMAVPSATAEPAAAYPVRSPAAPGLPNVRELQRALRPLRRYVVDRRRPVLDEAGTAQMIASTGVWAPVLVPGRERRFDAVLATDMAPSMRLWEGLEADLATLLTGAGSFRDVRICRLRPTPEGPMVQIGRSGTAMQLSQLMDGTGRRVFFVFSDTAGTWWHDGSAAARLARWARTAPLVVLQPLPEAMWSRTGLPALPARVTSPGAGAANSALRVRFRRRRSVGDVVPVVGLEPIALRSWARLVAGAASDVPLAVARVGAVPPAMPRTAGTDGRSAVQRFRLCASPQAYQLAVCLSVVPLTLDVMRLVQHVVVPGSTPSVLAEVLLGGMLVRTGEDSYEFVDGAKTELLSELRRSEAAMVSQAMSTFVAERAGSARRAFPALAIHPEGPVRSGAEQFALVPPVVAQQWGVPGRPDQRAAGTAEGATWHARIRDVGDRTLGSGVLISPRHVLTCAHVLGPAFPGPEAAFVVDFPGSGWHGTSMARVAADSWFPETPDGRYDIAILELEQRLADDVHPAVLDIGGASRGSRARIFDHPPGLSDGRWTRLTVGDFTGTRGGRLQLDLPAGEFPDLRGGSGAGVLDERSGRVVGILAAVARDRAAFMIPMEAAAEVSRHVFTALSGAAERADDLIPVAPRQRLDIVRIGFVGHGDLHPSAGGAVHAALLAHLRRYRQVHGIVTGVTGAAGLFAEAVHASRGTYEVVLPPGSRSPVDDSNAAALLQRAVGITRLADADPSGEVANGEVLSRCELLVAVWDGSAASGPGRAVALAQRRGVPVQVVWPAGARRSRPPAEPVRVFISYAHESAEHVEAVRRLVWLLWQNGVDAQLDLAASERLDWAQWMSQQLERADYIIVVASAAYRRHVESSTGPDGGRGARFEGMLLRNLLLSDRTAVTPKIVPVILPGGSEADLPPFVTSGGRQYIAIREMSPGGLEDLLRTLTGQPAHAAPAPGAGPALAPGELADVLDALLALPQLTSSLVREQVVRMLPPDMRAAIPEAPNARVQMLSILRVCAGHGPAGRAALLDVLRANLPDDDSRARAAIARVESSPIFG